MLTTGACEMADSRVTVYAPELGGVNCAPYCDGFTATMVPAEPGLVAACAEDRLYSTVWIEGVGLRQCLDVGGAIEGDDVDVLIDADDCEWIDGYCAHEWSAPRTTIFIRPEGGNDER